MHVLCVALALARRPNPRASSRRAAQVPPDNCCAFWALGRVLGRFSAQELPPGAAPRLRRTATEVRLCEVMTAERASVSGWLLGDAGTALLRAEPGYVTAGMALLRPRARRILDEDEWARSDEWCALAQLHRVDIAVLNFGGRLWDMQTVYEYGEAKPSQAQRSWRGDLAGRLGREALGVAGPEDEPRARRPLVAIAWNGSNHFDAIMVCRDF
jgi:hypothetical protein